MVAGEGRGSEAGAHQHVAVEHDGDGEDQAQPELPPEHGGVVAVVGMAAVLRRAGVLVGGRPGLGVLQLSGRLPPDVGGGVGHGSLLQVRRLRP